MIKQRGQTLVAMMIVLVIMLVLAVVFMRGSCGGNTESMRKDQLGKTTLGMARLAAKDDVCRNNLAQIRDAIQLFRTANGDEGYPQSIEELRLGHDFSSCPVGHEHYVYEPATGKVHCPHPGHEKY